MKHIYKIGTFHPFDDCEEELLLIHTNQYDEQQLGVMVQDVLDEFIDRACKENVFGDKGMEPCLITVGRLLNIIAVELKRKYGFERKIIRATTRIEDGKLFTNEKEVNRFLKERYADKVISACDKCCRKNMYNFDGCIVDNKRYPKSDDGEEDNKETNNTRGC
ncbi:hypothetical protein [uncultured Methanobrevibacter sp.]|uniref:hypothetical protein n=1 Tax=uncultured Methanobrevibacter sp. TaxID=253161 RepID=UPI0026386941|nr:hypothetical protein [uncultured Methanobrevibacter sp.]